MLTFIVGCVDYKAYDVKNPDGSTPTKVDDSNPEVNEISDIEKELEEDSTLVNDSTENNEIVENNDVVEEVVAPSLEANKSSNSSKGNDASDVTVLNVNENGLLKLKLTVVDPDKDVVNYTFSKPLNSKGEWKTNYGDAGEYLATITATDGKLTTHKKIKIVVKRVNVAPVIEELKDLKINEGATIKFEPKVTDPNKDPITVVVSDPLKSGSFVTDHTSAGVYTIKVTANDGELESSKSFKLVVNDVNVPPVISNLPKEINLKEGELVKLEPKVTDLDEKDKVNLTISDPVGNDGIWQTSYTDHGEYTVYITAFDGKDKIVEKVKINLADVNMPPQILNVSLATN